MTPTRPPQTLNPLQPARRLAVGAIVAALVLALLVVGPTRAEADDTSSSEDYQVLVVGKTLGFRHSSIDEATHAIIDLGEEHGFTVDVWDPPNDSGGWWGPGSPGQPELTLDSTPFTSAEDLAKYKTLVFVSPVDNTNDLDPDKPRLLDDDELAALQGYIHNGGGFVGLHAATDTMHTVPWYSELTGGGARFAGHPAQQQATMRIESPAHPSTAHLPLAWERFDEWYNFTTNPREDVHVLATLDESTYDPGGGAMGDDHPLNWCHNFEGGRSWYEGAGHTEASYADPAFLAHLLGGIEWTAGVASGGGDCVTWDEVDDLLDEVDADSPRERVGVRLVDRLLDRAERAADAGQRHRALGLLTAAERLSDVLLRDDLVTSKVADLAEWQRGLERADL